MRTVQGWDGVLIFSVIHCRERHLFGDVMVLAGLFLNLIVILFAVVWDIIMLRRRDREVEEDLEVCVCAALTLRAVVVELLLSRPRMIILWALRWKVWNPPT